MHCLQSACHTFRTADHSWQGSTNSGNKVTTAPKILIVVLSIFLGYFCKRLLYLCMK